MTKIELVTVQGCELHPRIGLLLWASHPIITTGFLLTLQRRETSIISLSTHTRVKIITFSDYGRGFNSFADRLLHYLGVELINWSTRIFAEELAGDLRELQKEFSGYEEPSLISFLRVFGALLVRFWAALLIWLQEQTSSEEELLATSA